MEHHVSSVIRGHHVSKSFWMLAIDEIVTAITKDSNTHHRFAVHAVPLSIHPDITPFSLIRTACA